jgi:hypothetical protein
MLLFAVFDKQGPAADWPLRHAHLLGPDDTVTPGEARFDRGLIRCERRGSDGACALAVMFPVDDVGGGAGSELTLRTCLLPSRAQPYLLALELARHRLMLLLNKLEEWSFFDLPADDPVLALIEQTREAFTKALMQVEATGGAGGRWFTPAADQAARAALALGLAASEELARRQAAVQHQHRLDGVTTEAISGVPGQVTVLGDQEVRASRAAVSGSPGLILTEMPKVAVVAGPNVFTPPLLEAVSASADALALSMRWVDLEPSEGKYATTPTDRWIEWAVTKAKLPVIAGPLVEFRGGLIPDFLYIWEHDYDTLREVVIAHVKKVVTRYRRTVHTWVACAGLPASVLPLNYEQVLDLTRTSVLLIRKLHPGAKVVVELEQPWGEYAGAAPIGQAGKLIPPTLYAELMNQLGLSVDALAVRVGVGQPAPGRSTRDLMAISAMLDRMSAAERPLMVTLSCPSAPANEGGRWHGAWTPQHQAEWLQAVGSMVAGKPYVQTVLWQGLVDEADATTGLLTAQGVAKPALAALRGLREALRNRSALP